MGQHGRDVAADQVGEHPAAFASLMEPSRATRAAPSAIAAVPAARCRDGRISRAAPAAGRRLRTSRSPRRSSGSRPARRPPGREVETGQALVGAERGDACPAILAASAWPDMLARCPRAPGHRDRGQPWPRRCAPARPGTCWPRRSWPAPDCRAPGDGGESTNMASGVSRVSSCRARPRRFSAGRPGQAGRQIDLRNGIIQDAGGVHDARQRPLRGYRGQHRGQLPAVRDVAGHHSAEPPSLCNRRSARPRLGAGPRRDASTRWPA